jgi:hypothetical protein
MFLAFLFSSLSLLIVAIFYAISSRVKEGTIGPIKLACLFALLPILSQLWFVLVPGALERTIFGMLAATFHDESLFALHTAFGLVNVSLALAGVTIGAYGKTRAKDKNIDEARERDMFNLPTSYFLITYSIAVVVFYIYSQLAGGLSSIWVNLHTRGEATAGLAYFHMLYQTFLGLSTAALYVKFTRSRRYVLALFLIILSILTFGAFGQRGQILSLLLLLLIVHHYKVAKIKRVFTISRLLALMLFVAASLIIVEYRKPSVSTFEDIIWEDVFNSMERSIISRVGVTERGMAVIGYFGENNYWGLSVYESVILAPIPRRFFPEKPPADTGRFLFAIAQGQQITPYAENAQLGNSWPDLFYAGYMSFGMPGFVIISLVSGMFWGYTYRLARRSSYSLPKLYFFASLVIWGVTALSPLNIINILARLLFVFVFVMIIRALQICLPVKERPRGRFDV